MVKKRVNAKSPALNLAIGIGLIRFKVKIQRCALNTLPESDISHNYNNM